MKREVFVVSAVRSGIGDFGGVFRSLHAIDLVSPVIEAAISNAAIPKESIGKIILGNTLSPMNPNIARGAAISCGIPPQTPCFSIHCACASAMQALISGASALLLGETETCLVGGVESMSNAPFILNSNRWGQRLRHAQATDLLWWCMQEDPIMGGMGVAADFLAAKYNITREEQDELAVLSHERAALARSSGRFYEEIVPIEAKSNKRSEVVDKDEHPRDDSSIEVFSKLRPAFSPDGTVTAGNASSLNDGAAAIVLATGSACKKYNLKPIARMRPWSIKATDPKLTGIAPVPAIREVLEMAGLSLTEVDLIEINEAFASYYIACEKELGLDREKVNVNGSGISLGHPVGATGARLVVTLIHEMIHRDASLGLASLCAGGGMGYAILFERMLS